MKSLLTALLAAFFLALGTSASASTVSSCSATSPLFDGKTLIFAEDEQEKKKKQAEEEEPDCE